MTTFKYKDGTTQSVKQEEFSSINHSITYSVIASDPSLTYTSVVSTIRVRTLTYN